MLILGCFFFFFFFGGGGGGGLKLVKIKSRYLCHTQNAYRTLTVRILKRE